MENQYRPTRDQKFIRHLRCLESTRWRMVNIQSSSEGVNEGGGMSKTRRKKDILPLH